MLSLLDKYLYDHLKQHTHCMSLDNEYVTLLQYAIHLHMDLTTFPTLWAVLSILLDTQDGKCEYVKCLQEEYNTYYGEKSRRYMLKLARQSVECQNCMYDSVTHIFDRVSGLHDNGLTPLQMQEGNQPVEDTTSRDRVIDIKRWKRETGIQYRCEIKEDTTCFIPKLIARPEYGTVYQHQGMLL